MRRAIVGSLAFSAANGLTVTVDTIATCRRRRRIYLESSPKMTSTPPCASSRTRESPRPGGVPAGRRSDVSLEVPGEVRLIVEAHAGGDIGGRVSRREALPE